ncbi:MAG: TM0996/MTH895 family glutaredoxin-like protein [Candidatus Cloacimonetes bacterium]|nr:TM0996/MTH895 family glutaredoxin-like protein [Candidatus Cloacimonadota bacterium]
MVIKVLGSGCTKCVKLFDNVKQAVAEMEIDAEVIKVNEIKEIISYGVMSTPALVVDEKVVSTGKLLKAEAIKKLLK